VNEFADCGVFERVIAGLAYLNLEGAPLGGGVSVDVILKEREHFGRRLVVQSVAD